MIQRDSEYCLLNSVDALQQRAKKNVIKFSFIHHIHDNITESSFRQNNSSFSKIDCTTTFQNQHIFSI